MSNLNLGKERVLLKDPQKQFGKKVNKDTKVQILKAINSRLAAKTSLAQSTTYSNARKTSIAPPTKTRLFPIEQRPKIYSIKEAHFQ